MANPEHLERLKEGVDSWNRWREQYPHLKVDLFQADLHWCKLQHANLAWANLSETRLFGLNLKKANLSHASLTRADLSWAHLEEATLRKANLRNATLFRAFLHRADLRDVNLESANLQNSNLSGANLTGSKLWETQRASWIIESVTCEFAYWDSDGMRGTEYCPGEFERIYSHQTSIDFLYPGGVSTFELSTLPALLYYLSSKHPNTNIRLKAIEETGGGAKITLSLGDADQETKQSIEKDVMQVVQAQLALRDDDVKRLQIEKQYLEAYVPKLMKELLGAAKPNLTYNGSIHTELHTSGQARIELHQTFNDNSELIKLIDKFLTNNTQLTAPQSKEIEAARSELQNPNPDKPRLTRFYEFLKSLPKEAVLKSAGKLGEKAAEADYSNLLHHFGNYIHNLPWP